jgi:hypothetical protein
MIGCVCFNDWGPRPLELTLSIGLTAPQNTNVMVCRYLINSAGSSSSSNSSGSSLPVPGSFPPLAGAAFLASVPPAGNRDLIFRYIPQHTVGAVHSGALQ